jgi:hypothetical protein
MRIHSRPRVPSPARVHHPGPRQLVLGVWFSAASAPASVQSCCGLPRAQQSLSGAASTLRNRQILRPPRLLRSLSLRRPPPPEALPFPPSRHPFFDPQPGVGVGFGRDRWGVRVWRRGGRCGAAAGERGPGFRRLGPGFICIVIVLLYVVEFYFCIFEIYIYALE